MGPTLSSSTKLDASRLEALLESAQLLQTSLDLETLLRHLLRTVMGRLLVRRGLVAVRQSDGVLRLALVRGASALTVDTPYDEAAARAAGIEIVMPIGEGDQPVGLLGISAPTHQMEAGELEFVRALLGMAVSVISHAQAHEEARRANQLLDQRLQELRALVDLGRGLAATLDPEEVARLVGLTLAGRWAVSKYGVLAWKEGHAFTCRQRGLTTPTPGPWQELAAALPDASFCSDEHDPFAEYLRIPPGSLLLPVRSNDATVGLIVCGTRPRGMAYRGADLEFGAGLAAQAAVAFESAWNFRETLQKKQMEKELTLAAQIQADLFPAQMPPLAGIQMAARNRQARQVGGDYFDAIPFSQAAPDQPYLLCVADISGKGLPASLLMSNIQATLRALLTPGQCLSDLAARANNLLYASTPANRYATAFLFSLDPVSGRCSYVNCGHNAGILLRASGDVELLEASGLALGLFPGMSYEATNCQLQAGDVLAIYSDGVTEAQNLQEQEFEIERLIATMQEHCPRSVAEIVEAVFTRIDEFAGTAPQFDDITMLIVKREA